MFDLSHYYWKYPKITLEKCNWKNLWIHPFETYMKLRRNKSNKKNYKFSIQIENGIIELFSIDKQTVLSLSFQWNYSLLIWNFCTVLFRSLSHAHTCNANPLLNKFPKKSAHFDDGKNYNENDKIIVRNGFWCCQPPHYAYYISFGVVFSSLFKKKNRSFTFTNTSAAESFEMSSGI